MLLHWRRRGGATPLLSQGCQETTSCAGQAPASKVCHERLSQSRPFPRLLRSEPVVQHKDGINPETRCRCPTPLCGDCDAHKFGKHPFVSRLLSPVLFRKRQPNKQGSEMQRHNSGWSPHSRSVPVYFPSHNNDACTVATQHATRTPAGGNSHPSRTDHTNGPGVNACTQATSAPLRETERLPTSGVVPVEGPSAKQGSILQVSRIVTAAARVAGRSHHVPEMQRSEGAAGIRDTQGRECRLLTKWHPAVARRYLDATSAGCSAGHAQSNTNVPPSNHGFRGSKLPEITRGGVGSGLPGAASGVDCSTPLNQLRGHDNPHATGAATAKHTTASTVAAAVAASSGHQFGSQKDPQPGKVSPRSVQRASVEKLIASVSARPVVEKNKALKTENPFYVAHSVPQVTHCFPCADKKPTPQRADAQHTLLGGVGEASQQGRRRTAILACSSRGDQAQLKADGNNSSSNRTCDRSPQPTVGVQQQISSSTFYSQQNKSIKTAPEECSSATDSREKTNDALRASEQATVKEGSLRTTGWRSVPCAPLGGDKVRTLWSVESLSDALVVRRGLATVLLIDGVGSAVLLHRALSKHSDWQQQVQQNALSASTDEEVKLLDEMPAKVRSKSVILKILQGAVSLQQVLPVDVTQAQADLRLLSLQQLLVLRLKNYHEFELNSQYHSCHASFLRTLDCRIAELLGAFLVNEAFFDLFAPFVEQLQQTLASKKTCIAGVQQSLTCEERHSSSQALCTPSFSGASTRCSSPQATRNIDAEREETVVATVEERSKGAETCKRVVGCSEQPMCRTLNNNRADAAGDAGLDERVEGRKLRWGHVTWIRDLQRRSKAESSSACLSMPPETPKTIGTNTRGSLSSLGRETVKTTETDVCGSLSSSSVCNILSNDARAAGINRHAPGDIGKAGSGGCASERQKLQEEFQQQQQGHAAAMPKVDWRSSEKTAASATGKQEYTEHVNSSAKAEKSRGTLVEAQARLLVERAAAKGLLSTYSPSSFDLPNGEAAATRAQLRALGAAFVRQLGVLVSAAAKGEVSSSGPSSNGISAADMRILRRVQKHVLQEKNEQEEQEEVEIEEAANSRTIPQDNSQIYRKKCHMHEKGVAAGKWINAKTSGSPAFSAAPATALTRPDGVWVRLLVPWKSCTAKKTLGSTKDGAKSCFPVTTAPSPVSAAADGSHRATGAEKGREKGSTAEEQRVTDTAAAQNVVADAARCSGSKTHPAIAAAARTNLMAAIAAARERRANTAVRAETEVETPSGEEKSPQKEWMEAFLWLRLPTPRGRQIGSTAEAAADRKCGQKIITLHQPQQIEHQEVTAAEAGKTVFGRGVFEVVVSNDRPVGEALLWGLAPQNSKLLCKDSGPGCSSGISSAGKLAKWTVALLPETAVLQQHMGHDAQVNDVVSELKELLSRRCGAMKPAAEYQGGAVTAAATSATPVATR